MEPRFVRKRKRASAGRECFYGKGEWNVHSQWMKKEKKWRFYDQKGENKWNKSLSNN